MQLVLDTNVLVSALWKPTGPPAVILRAVQRLQVVPVFDHRILDEYRDVLSRPRLAQKVGVDAAQAIVEKIAKVGTDVSGLVEPYAGPLPDEDDRPFAEVARTAGGTLVTGNARDFPLRLESMSSRPPWWLPPS